MIQFADGNKASTEELRADVEAAKKKFNPRDFCFSLMTVEGLLNYIAVLENQIENSPGIEHS